MLLAQRVELKMKGKQVGGIMNRLYVAAPQPRDNKKRDTVIPDGVLERRSKSKVTNVEMDDDDDEKPRMTVTFGGPSGFDVPADFDPQKPDTEDLRGKQIITFYLNTRQQF